MRSTRSSAVESRAGHLAPPTSGGRGTPGPARRGRRGETASAIWFLLPGALLFLGFVLGPLVFSLRISFFDWNIIDPAASEWLGLDNYARALDDPIFRRAVVNTAAYTAVTVPAQLALGVGVALLLNQAIRGRTIYRVLYYLPVITPWVIVTLVFEFIFLGQGGLANWLLKDVLGITSENIRWLADPILTFVPIFLLGIWKGIGWVAIIVLAGLQSIPPEYEDAASVDGAGPVARFRFVVLPLLRPTMVFLGVVLTIGGLNAYISNLLITDGGNPQDKTHFVLTLMHEATFERFDFGYGSAISYLLTAVVLAVSVVQIKLLRRRVDL